MTRTQTTLTLAATAFLAGLAAYVAGTSTTSLLLSAGFIAFIAMMWREARCRRENPEASDVLLGFAAGVAGMFLVVALELARLAELQHGCGR